MFGKGFHLFTLYGFRISVDPSWFFLAVLIVWSLAQGYFPAVVEGLQPATYWWLAIFGALGLFASIVFHEFAHSIVARHFDMPIAGITLFLFGGVAQLRDEPPSARAEFFVAIAGPISSYLLAAVLYVLLLPFAGGESLGPVAAVLSYLMLINLILATFNLLPAFPLDGGRVLRAAVWAWTGSLRRATRVGAVLGRGLGTLLMVLGVLDIVSGNFIGGMWIALIGFFIIGAASASEMQMELKLGFEGVRVGRIMHADPIVVSADISVAELADEYFYRHYHKAFPVVRAGRFVGCVRLKDVGALPRGEWQETTVADILTEEGARQVVRPDAPALEALKRMQETNVSRLVVVDGGEVKGMLTMRDLMAFFTVRRELQGGAAAGRSAVGHEREAS